MQFCDFKCSEHHFFQGVKVVGKVDLRRLHMENHFPRCVQCISASANWFGCWWRIEKYFLQNHKMPVLRHASAFNRCTGNG